MNSAIKAGEVFQLKNLVEYQEGAIAGTDVVVTEDVRFVLKALDKGTGMPPHSAPGDVIVFCLDGEGIVGYEGKEHAICAGENFHFKKGAEHYVKTEHRMKLAVLHWMK